MSPAKWTAVWLGLGLAGAIPTAGRCFEAGVVSVAPIAIERGPGLVEGGLRARGLKLDLRLGEGGGRLTLGALSGGEDSPFLLTSPEHATDPFAPLGERADGARRHERLELAHSRRLGPIGYRLGIATGYGPAIEDGSPTGRRRFTLSGEVSYAGDELPRLGLRAGLGYWEDGRPSLRALDMGSAWALEGTVELGRLVAPAGWREALRAVLRFGATGYHGAAAPDQPRGVDFRIGIGAGLRF